MAFYYYDDYDPGPSYYDPEPDFYAPSVQYDAYYKDPGPEPAYDDYHPAAYNDAHGSPLYHAENISYTPYDFLADEPLPYDEPEGEYADPSYTDYDDVDHATPSTYDALGDVTPAPYDFLADQPLDWEDDDEVETPYEVGYAVDAADSFGMPLSEGWSCGDEQSRLEDEFEEEYDPRAEGLAAAFDATRRGVPISLAYGLGPQPDDAPAVYAAASDGDDDGRCSPSFTEEYNAEADCLAAEFDFCWQFGIPIPRAWAALETNEGNWDACEGEFDGTGDEAEAGAYGGQYREPEYVADLISSPSSFHTDPYHDDDAHYDDPYAPYAARTDFWAGTCTLDDQLCVLAMQSTARRLAFEYDTLPDPIPHLRPLSPYPDDGPAPEFDDTAYDYELARYHDAFAALARTATAPQREPALLPFCNEAVKPAHDADETDTLSWSMDDEERLQACMDSFAGMQLAGYYPPGFDATPLALYEAYNYEQHCHDTVPAYLVSDAYRARSVFAPSRHRPRPSRPPRFRLPRPRNTSPPRRKRPPDKLPASNRSNMRRSKRQPRSRTPTRPRRDPPPHLPRSFVADELKDAKIVVLPDDAVPPDKHVHLPCITKVADTVAVLREPAPPDRRDGKMPLTVEQRRRNALRRIARKKPK